MQTPTFELTAKQRQLRDAAASQARHILGVGGSRSGKTFGFCYCVGTRAISSPNSRHLICRLHNIDVRQSVMMDTWPKMMRTAYPHVPYETNKTDQFVKLPNGAEVWFLGLDDKERVEKILGKEYATIYPNEASQIAYDTVLTLRTRLAQNCTKTDGRPLPLKMYYDLNPTGRGHWTYREFIEGVNPVDGREVEPGSRAHVFLNPADNPYLPKAYLDELDGLPERQRQRFRDGKYLTEVPGSLWSLSDRVAEDGKSIPGIDSTRAQIEWSGDKPAVRYRGATVALTRIVIGVDPSGSDGTGGDLQGIIAAGVGIDGRGYVLEDGSCRLSPAGWAAQVKRLYDRWGADKVVAEANYGGAMVESTMRGADPNMPVALVTASRGKHLRAEPISALYEQGKVSHAGFFPVLEEQMGMMTTSGCQSGGSPDRVDGLVWALTELMLEGANLNGWLSWAQQKLTPAPGAPNP